MANIIESKNLLNLAGYLLKVFQSHQKVTKWLMFIQTHSIDCFVIMCVCVCMCVRVCARQGVCCVENGFLNLRRLHNRLSGKSIEVH